jgi:hypothetical protein
VTRKTVHDWAHWAREVADDIETNDSRARKAMPPVALRLLADLADAVAPAEARNLEGEWARLRAREAHADNVERVLALVWEDRESLMWDNDGTRLLVECSDTFWWATADAQAIDLPGDLESLAAARREFPDDDWPLLWCCRKRGMRPMPRWSRDRDPADPFTAAVLAAGPERTPEMLAP